MVEHHDAIDHPHQHAHDVLDPDDGDAELVADLAQHVGGLVHLVLVESAEAFVGEQEFRAGGERLCKLELFQAGRAERVDGGVAVGRQTDHGKRLLGGFIRLGAAVAALAVEAGQFDILEDGEAAERPRDLEGAADAAIDDGVRGVPCDLATRRTRSSRLSAPTCPTAC